MISVRILPALGIFLACALSIRAQQETSSAREVEVEAEAHELPSAYGAPPDLSHGRISTLTKSYVLSPFSCEIETGYEGVIFRHDPPLHIFRNEIEMGLPSRFTVGVQNEFGRASGDTDERSFTLEARYAFANWNKLPLNPALSAEYRFGLNDRIPDSGALTLLVSHDFPYLVEWALNAYVDHEFGARTRTNGGFVQSVEVPVLLPEEKLEIGLEMEYRTGGVESAAARRESKGLAIGPTLAWRANPRVRFDLSPLIGCSDHAPALQVFAIVSVSLGRGPAKEAEKLTAAR